MSEETVEETIPASFQAKLFDLTGQKEGGSKGFLLLYVNMDGAISVITKAQNECVHLALQKANEVFVKNNNIVNETLGGMNNE